METIPPELSRLVEYIEGLQIEQRTELLALFWYAHADERGLPFTVLLTHARTSVDHLPEYVAGMDNLEGSLRLGLAKLSEQSVAAAMDTSPAWNAVVPV